MKKLLLAAVLVLSLSTRLFAEAENRYLAVSDRLSREGKYQQSISLLLGKLPSTTDPEDRAEIYWRLSRDTLRAADRLAIRGAAPRTLLRRVEQGEAYGTKAIENDPTTAQGFLWKAANLGRWRQAWGELASLREADIERSLLRQAARLDPNLAEVWFVLGRLYSRVPSFPISFGSTSYAVSLDRKAIGERKAEVARGGVPSAYYLQLAGSLEKRGWSAAKRAEEHSVEAQEYAQTTDPVERNDFYEGSVTLAPISDRAEAIDLVRTVAAKLEETAHRTPRQQHELNNALTDLTAWRK